MQLKARAFGMFLKSQRQWNSKPLDEKVAKEFIESYKVPRDNLFLCLTWTPWVLQSRPLNILFPTI